MALCWVFGCAGSLECGGSVAFTGDDVRRALETTANAVPVSATAAAGAITAVVVVSTSRSITI